MTAIDVDSAPVCVEPDVACVCRDGTILRADVYRPGDGGRYPTLINRTPYGKREPRYVSDAHTLAARGYTVIVQDQRGRYASDGDYKWMFRDRLETLDAARRVRCGGVGRAIAVERRARGHVGPFKCIVGGVDAGLVAAARPQGDAGERHGAKYS